MLAVAGGKGGTGKTTTALALARAIATKQADASNRQIASKQAGASNRQNATNAAARGRVDGPSTPRNALVVDADVDMPDAHAMAGVARTPTVLDRPRGSPAPDLAGVRVAPAPPADASTAFRETLADLATRTDDDLDGSVIVDAPCGAGPDVALPLSVADHVVLVTRPTPAAIRDAAKTAAMARALDTPLAAAAIVGESPGVRLDATNADRSRSGRRGARSIADALDVPAVVPIPRVTSDPFQSRDHRTAISRLHRAVATRDVKRRTGRHLFTE